MSNLKTKPITNNQSGFTLVELMLAMALSAIILLISTIGFIGINRTFTKANVRRQLSEGVQRLNEDITRTVRSTSTSTVPRYCAPANNDGCPTDNNWAVICFTGIRYAWRNTEPFGLYRDTKTCGAAVTLDSNTQTLLPDRYIVQPDTLMITKLEGPLYRIQGVIRTTETEAFILPGDSTTDDVVSPFDIRCKGTTQSSASNTCAIENFNFIVASDGGVV